MADRYYIPGSEDAARGGADWNDNGKPDFIFGHDPRYKTCLETAQNLKMQYGPEMAELAAAKGNYTIAQKQRLNELEEKISTAVNQVMHEQFGSYNTAIAAGASARDHPSLRGDWGRMDSADGFSSTELEKDTLICRHYGAIGNALLAEAGLQSGRVMSINKVLARKGDDLVESNRYPEQTAHITTVSLLTGNVFEFTLEGGGVFNGNITGIVPDQYERGSVVLYGDKKSVTYNQLIATKYAPDEYFELVPKARQNAEAEWQKALPDIKQLDSLIAHIHSGDVAAVKEMIPHTKRLTPSVLFNGVLSAMDRQNWGMTELLLDNGAMADICKDPNILSANSPEAIEIKKDMVIATFTDSAGNQRQDVNPEFQRGLIKKLGITAQAYLDIASEAKQPAHMALAQKMVDEEKARGQQQAQVKDAQSVSMPQGLGDDVMAKALAAVNIPKEMLAQMQMGADNLGAGVTAVGQPMQNLSRGLG